MLVVVFFNCPNQILPVLSRGLHPALSFLKRMRFQAQLGGSRWLTAIGNEANLAVISTPFPLVPFSRCLLLGDPCDRERGDEIWLPTQLGSRGSHLGFPSGRAILGRHTILAKWAIRNSHSFMLSNLVNLFYVRKYYGGCNQAPFKELVRQIPIKRQAVVS